jgi:hypothetical protein
MKYKELVQKARASATKYFSSRMQAFAATDLRPLCEPAKSAHVTVRFSGDGDPAEASATSNASGSRSGNLFHR